MACCLAVQCCLDLHKKLGNFPTAVPDKFFTLHIGMGFGLVTILQVGGTLERWEYVVAGPPMQQISVAEPLAASGETVISPDAMDAISLKHLDLQFVAAEDGTPYGKVHALVGIKVPPPPPLEKIDVEARSVDLIQRFIPPAIFKRLTAGYNVFVNELRQISVVFVGVNGLDVSNNRGSQLAHRLMQLTQKAAYTMEGSVNKFLVDDKGVLILIMFGLPPVYHLDDSLRAVMTSMRVVDGLKSLNLKAGIGVASGRVWCGTVGCQLRKEYTAMGDTVNLAARLMGKASRNEIFCDQDTKKECEHVMEFLAHEPVLMKGKANPVPIFQPTGQMKRLNLVAALSREPLLSWPDWKPRRKLNRLLLSSTLHRPPIIGLDRAPLDLPIAIGPVLPWEFVEPWMPTLQPTIQLGGVMVIRGSEYLGTPELLEILKLRTLSDLNRYVFVCSNMPDATHVNIGNVPLLAWRKLCTDMIQRWRSTKGRERKGFSRVNRDNSVCGLAKELLHPILHWRLAEMKSVISGLVMPSEVGETNFDTGAQRVNSVNKKNRGSQIGSYEHLPSVKRKSRLESDAHLGMLGPAPGESLEEEQSVAPIICSLVNGFTMFEPTVICLHVRSGTSVYASMDAESWKVARLVGRLTMMRRRRKIEFDMKELKRWRRRHSRDCWWCKGYPANEPIETTNGIMTSEWTPACKPPESRYFPPLVFVLICSDETDQKTEQQELIEWARECNAFISMKHFQPSQTRSYLAHCLEVAPTSIPEALVDYVHRVSAGFPRFISCTQRQLLAERAIQLVASRRRTDRQSTEELDDSGDSSRDDNSASGSQDYEGGSSGGDGEIYKDVDQLAARPPAAVGSSIVDVMRSVSQKLLVYEFDRKQECSLANCQPHNLYRDVLRIGNVYMHNRVAQKLGLSITPAAKLGSITSGTPQSEPPTLTKQDSRMHLLQSDNAQPNSVGGMRIPHLRSSLLRGKHNMNLQHLKKSDTSGILNFVRNTKRHPTVSPVVIPPGPAEHRQETGGMLQVDAQADDYFQHVDRKWQGSMNVEIVKELKDVPYVAELKAAAMFVMERLEPDEQLAAKCAACFPAAFTCFELQVVYPQAVLPSKFAKIMTNLLQRGVLENTTPPSDANFQFLFNDQDFSEGRRTDLVLPDSVSGPSPETASKANSLMTASGAGSLSSNVADTSTASNSTNPSVVGNNTNTLGIENVPGEVRFSVHVSPSSVGEACRDSLSSVSTASAMPSSDYQNNISSNTNGLNRVDSRRVTPTSLVDELHTSARLRSSGMGDLSDAESGSSDSDGDTEQSTPVQKSLVVDRDGNPLFYRFKSTAFQHVVGELLLSEERLDITRTAVAAVATRLTQGCDALIRYATERFRKQQLVLSEKRARSQRYSVGTSLSSAAKTSVG
eukprot:Lankesteria_metandrocarpae@DN2890_c0_g1_i1.p1